MGAGLHDRGRGSSQGGLASFEEETSDVKHASDKYCLDRKRLAIRDGGVGLITSADIGGEAYVGCQALVLDSVSQRGVDHTFQRLPERPMVAGS